MSGGPNDRPVIGIFDSGVGGLTVLKEIQRRVSGTRLIYLADQAHVPYGDRELQELRSFCSAISRFLIAQGARVIVIACNTASAAALHELRRSYPQISFVGLEPAIKPAVSRSRSRVIGVLATAGTFHGGLYARLVGQYAQDARLLRDTCPGLVSQIEAGELESPVTRDILERAIHPMLQAGADTLVLGCTHYGWTLPLIREIAGSAVEVIDPAPAVARQTERVLRAAAGDDSRSQPVDRTPAAELTRYLTTGAPEDLEPAVEKLFGYAQGVQRVRWIAGTLARARS